MMFRSSFPSLFAHLLSLLTILSSNMGSQVRAHPIDPSAAVTAETRELMDTLFSDFALDNFGQSFADALSDDLTWTVTGSSPIAGKYEGKQIYLEKVLTPLRDVLEIMPVPIIDRILVDNDWAVVNWHSQGVKGKNGADYDMSYAWVMRVDNKKIVEVIGFYDGQKVAAVFEGYEGLAKARRQ